MLLEFKMSGKIEIPSHYLNGVSFSMFTSEEVLKLSVKELVNSQSFDQIGHPTIGGLYDPALGPTDQNDQCKTCSLGHQICPGHMGHIKLPLAVFHPVFFKTLYQVSSFYIFFVFRSLLITHGGF